MPDLSDKIRELMRLQNMSQARLSEQSHISKTQISNILTKKSIPRIDTLELICKALDIDIGYLLTEEVYEFYSIRKKNVVVNKMDKCEKSIMEYTYTKENSGIIDGIIKNHICYEDIYLDKKRERAINFVINSSPVVLNLFLKFAQAIESTQSYCDDKE